MKISFKHVLAVGALAVVSTAAFADAVVPNGGVVTTYSGTTPMGDNGGLVFSLFSKNSDTTYSLNNYLGLSLNDVVPTEMSTGGMTLTWHLSGISVPSNVAASDLVWGVTAADNGSVSVADSIRLVTTANRSSTNIGPASTISNQGIANVTNNWNTIVTLNNNSVNDSPVDSTTVALSPSDLYDKFNTNDAQADFSWVTATNDTLDMYLYSQSAGRGHQNDPALVSAKYAGVWSLDLATSTLTYKVAAVPLPAAVWLLFSGLAGVGVIGRRKSANDMAAA